MQHGPSQPSGDDPVARESSALRRRVAWGVGFGVAVVIGLALFADASALATHLGSFAPFALVPALGLVTVGYFIRVVKWEIYLARLGIRLPTTESWLTFFGGMVMSISPGKVGEVLKSFVIKSRHGISVATTAPIVVAERLTDLIAIVLLAAWGLSRSDHGLWVVGFSAAGAVLLLVTFSHRRAGDAMVALARRVSWLAKVADKLAEALRALRALLSVKTMLATSALSVGAWILECIATWLLLQAFPMVDIDLATATFIFAFSTLAGAVSMLPGGLGLTEGSMIALLTVVFEVMPDVEMATAATLVVRFCTLWFGVILGGAALWILTRLEPGKALVVDGARQTDSEP